MARKKNYVGCLGMLFLWPFYFIWFFMKFGFLLVWEMIKFPFYLIKELSQGSYTHKRKGATGRDYELFIVKYLESCGYHDVTATRATGDFGVDVIAYKGLNKYAVQCKYYSYPVGIEAVQQVVGGMAHYGCNKAMVITNNTFTDSAKRLASENGVKLKQHIELGHTNGLLIFRFLMMVLFSALMLGTLHKINSDGIKSIPNEEIPAYLAIPIIFSILVLSYIIPKAIEEIKHKKTTRNLKRQAQDIQRFISQPGVNAKSRYAPRSKATRNRRQ